MTTQYFSDQDRGPLPRTTEIISSTAWGGIVAAVISAVRNVDFGEDFPQICPDGSCVYGTDEQAFSLAMRAEIPGLEWPLRTELFRPDSLSSDGEPCGQETLDILDLIQFCYTHVSKAVQERYHDYFSHYHCSFDRDAGRKDFRERINTVFSRNGIAYDLCADGSIRRLAPTVLAEALRIQLPTTGDDSLDQMIKDARRKFFSPDISIRKEALEKLWDAWERLKSLKVPGDKPQSAERLLRLASVEPEFFSLLDQEAKALTEIGNHFMIRHSEVGKVPIASNSHVDYLFHRMFALIHFCVRAFA